MASSNRLRQEGSVEQDSDKQTDAETDEQVVEAQAVHGECPACDSRVVADDVETYCRDCGLVVQRDELDRAPSPLAHGPDREGGPQEWALEPNTEFRVNKGLGGVMILGGDGKSNPLSEERRSRLRRMKKFHQRMDDRERRLADALRDVENISTNADLPQWVGEDAARLMRQADAERLAGGHMAWESLACGAVLLATKEAGIDRDPAAITHYAKTSHERACAAARKIRTECGLVDQLAPLRPGIVDDVLAGLDDELCTDTVLEYARIARLLMDIADTEPIGPGTPRVTMAATAVYVADRLTDGKALTQAAVVDAGSRIVETSEHKIGRYSRRVHDAYRERHGQVAPETVLERTQTPDGR